MIMPALFTRSSRKMTPEQWRTYQLERRDRLVDKMHKHLGGRCVECGTTDDLQLHHKNPDEKQFDPTRCNRAWSAILIELQKCELRCGPCHRRQHYAKHGTVTRYYVNHACRCDDCVAAYKPWKAAADRRHYHNRSPERVVADRLRNAAAARRYRERKKWFVELSLA